METEGTMAILCVVNEALDENYKSEKARNEKVQSNLKEAQDLLNRSLKPRSCPKI